jgi:hypothetical protein
MFWKRQREDEKLKELLNDSWPADAHEERISFLKRLKIILQPDHPGLLCMPGKAKKVNGASRDHFGAAKWRLHGVMATVATYGFIIVALGAAAFGLKYLFALPTGDSTIPEPGNRGVLVLDRELEEEIPEDYMRFIYRFRDIEITRDKQLTIAQLTEEINDNYPADEEITITGMKQVEVYEEEERSVLYKVYVFLLEGFWQPKERNETDEENGFSGID